MLQNVRDTVLIKGEENVPSTQWRIGKLKKLVTGKDAQVRSAELVVIFKSGGKDSYTVPFEITKDNCQLSK